MTKTSHIRSFRSLIPEALEALLAKRPNGWDVHHEGGLAVKVVLYCKCGSGSEGHVSSPPALERFRALWYEEHGGEGHGDCEREEAVAAYRKMAAGKPPSPEAR